jgi:hypothetical protein
LDLLTQAQGHALFAYSPDEGVANAGADCFSNGALSSYNGHLQAALSQACSDFHAYEARAQDDGAFTAFRLRQYGIGVLPGSQQKHVPKMAAG